MDRPIKNDVGNGAAVPERKAETAGEIKALMFRMYDRAVDVVILGVIPLMLIALGLAFIEAVIGTAHMIPVINSGVSDTGAAPDEIALRELVERVLDVVILIELFNTFMEYARTRHIRLSNLLDVTIFFGLREMLIKLYAQNFSSSDLLALCVVVIVLVVARGITTGFSSEAEARPRSRTK